MLPPVRNGTLRPVRPPSHSKLLAVRAVGPSAGPAGLALLSCAWAKSTPGRGPRAAIRIPQPLPGSEAVAEGAATGLRRTRGMRFALQNPTGMKPRPGNSMRLGEKDRTPYEIEDEKEDAPSEPEPAPVRHEPRREMILRAPIRLRVGGAGTSPAPATFPRPRG